jgi:hypothetical protein
MPIVTFSYCYTDCHYADFHYADCHYAEFHYAECQCAQICIICNPQNFVVKIRVTEIQQVS